MHKFTELSLWEVDVFLTFEHTYMVHVWQMTWNPTTWSGGQFSIKTELMLYQQTCIDLTVI